MLATQTNPAAHPQALPVTPLRRRALVLALLAAGLSALPAAPALAAWTAAPAAGVSVAAQPGAFQFDPRTNRFFTLVRVSNTDAEALSAPLRLVVASSSLMVANAHGTTAGGKPYFNLPAPGRGLPAGAVAGTVRVDLQRVGRTKPTLTLAMEVEDTPFPLQLLHVADIDSTSALAALDNALGFSALLDHFRADPTFGANSLTLSSGDNWIPGPRYSDAADPRLASLLGIPAVGRGDVAMLNAMGFQASTLGNHEMDQGPAVFASLLMPQTVGSASWPGAAFPYLSTNLDFNADVATAPLVVGDGQPAAAIPGQLAGWATIDVAGQTIGIVGATTPTLGRISSPRNIGIFPANPDDLDALAAEIQAGVDALRATGVNKVIVLAHMQQIAVELDLAQRLRGVDIIVAGGSNSRLLDSDDVLFPGDTDQGRTYPLERTGADGNPVLIVNTDADYKYLGRLAARFDVRGLIDPASLDPSVNGAWATHDARLADVGVTRADADPDLTDIAEILTTVVSELRANVVGKTAVFLDGATTTVRRQESNLGNLTADANLWTARQTDHTVQVSIKNGGGIRASVGSIVFPPGSTDPADAQRVPPPDGNVSQLDAQSALAFNNGLTLVTLTAAELQAIIEHGVGRSDGINTQGRFPQVAGIRFSWDRSLSAGSRVRSLAVVDDSGAVVDTVVQDGALVGDPARTFRTVTLNFLVNDPDGNGLGGDDYPFPQTDRVDLVQPGAPLTGQFVFAPDGSEQDALAEYLGTFFAEVPFDLPETAQLEDRRIQDLAVAGKTDTVLALPPGALNLVKIGGLALGGAEIVSYDPTTQRLFVAGAGTGNQVYILDFNNPTAPTVLDSFDPKADVAGVVPGFVGGDVSSVSYKNGLLAAAVVDNPKTAPGYVAFYDVDGGFLGAKPAGALPDMVTWDPAGERVLAANEGEPGATDPEGSVTVIDVPATGTPADRVAGAIAHQLDFEQFNGQEADLRLDGVRIFPGVAAANDFEPEYITVAADDSKAWVGMQEANTLAVVNLSGTTYVIEPNLIPLGTKDHSRLENALDASDKDGPGPGPAIKIGPWPVRGLYMPDGIGGYDPGLGRTFVLTANEGDARTEDQRIGHSSIVLDAAMFPDATSLKQNANLGRLNISTIDGNTGSGGAFERLFTYGARSFTIRDIDNGTLADSNDDFARVTAQQTPTLFNANDGVAGKVDQRSDDKGAEAEAVIVGEIDGRWYAFIGLERAGGGVMVYDATNPHLPRFVSYTPGAPNGDISVEGMVFISAAQSPNGKPLVVTANEVSQTIAIYEAQPAP